MTALSNVPERTGNLDNPRTFNMSNTRSLSFTPGQSETLSVRRSEPLEGEKHAEGISTPSRVASRPRDGRDGRNHASQTHLKPLPPLPTSAPEQSRHSGSTTPPQPQSQIERRDTVI
jgi:hypothetical protein